MLSEFEGTVYHVEEGKVLSVGLAVMAEAWGGWLYRSTVRKQIKMTHDTQLFILLELQPMGWRHPHSGRDFSPYLKLLWKCL